MDRKKINNEHCCQTMRNWIANKDKDCPFSYNPKVRYYHMTVPNKFLKKNEIWFSYPFIFCPACGTKLPSGLVEQWMEILKNEHGIEDTYFQRKSIPKEFKTDEWWKKRGL